jgi:hypothetical protein
MELDRQTLYRVDWALGEDSYVPCEMGVVSESPTFCYILVAERENLQMFLLI